MNVAVVSALFAPAEDVILTEGRVSSLPSEVNVLVKGVDCVLPLPAPSRVTFSSTWTVTVPSDAPFVTENVYTAPVPVKEPESIVLMLAEPPMESPDGVSPMTDSEKVRV
jgi:hypothetical protein